jgi:hypothetical protein
MPLPPSLQSVLAAARRTLHAHPQHALILGWSDAVVAAVSGNCSPALARTSIDLCAARQVLPIWEQVFPGDWTPQSWLDLAEQVVTRQVPGEKADGVWEVWREGVNYVLDRTRATQEQDAYAAGEAAHRALIGALVWDSGRRLTKRTVEAPPNAPTVEAAVAAVDTTRDEYWAVAADEHLVLIHPDVDLSEWHASFWASVAFAHGTPWNLASDAARRQAFWEWWLDEAVPTAWEAIYGRPFLQNR